MRRRTKRILSISSIVFVLLVTIFIVWFDWNMIKPYVERQVTEKTGREFVIQDLDVRLSLNPLISAEGISLANAEWGTEQPMLGVDKVAFRISLWDLLLGDIVLPEVSVAQSKIILEKSADGKRNWDLKKEEEKEAELPKIGRLTLEEGQLTYRDPKTETDIMARIFTDPTDAREMPLDVAAEGKFTGLEFKAQSQGGKIMSLADKT